MKPLRSHVAIAIDGGGLKGVIPARALAILEEYLGRPCSAIFRVAAGTSTGSIISAGIGAGLSAQDLHGLYLDLGSSIFRRSWRTALFPLTRYRYPGEPLERALRQHLGELSMADLWQGPERIDVVITAFDLVENRTRFIKPWKTEYAAWPLYKAVMASSTVPTLFPVVDGRYVDGGVGSYTNPCYLAAYEAICCLGWPPEETTLISLGCGHPPAGMAPGAASRLRPWNWLSPVAGAFLQSADHQQQHLVDLIWPRLDFRRFQVPLPEPIPSDDPARVPELSGYGALMGEMILNDDMEEIAPLQLPREAVGEAAPMPRRSLPR